MDIFSTPIVLQIIVVNLYNSDNHNMSAILLNAREMLLVVFIIECIFTILKIPNLVINAEFAILINWTSELLVTVFIYLASTVKPTQPDRINNSVFST